MPDQQLPAEAPDFTLEHVLGHSVSLRDFRGRTVVAVFGGQESAKQVEQGIERIRLDRDPDELPILAVTDLRAAPRPARPLVKRMLKKEFDKAVKHEVAALEAAGKPARADPEMDVNMLLDWKGETASAFGLGDAAHEAVGVVIDEDGRTIGSGSGAKLGEEVLAVLSSR